MSDHLRCHTSIINESSKVTAISCKPNNHVVASVALFCKSYSRDVHRAKRLVDSIEAYNSDHIPFFLGVPQQDLPLFRNVVGSMRCEWVTDEDICTANPKATVARLRGMDGRIAQQVIKSEFWRLIACNAYLALDSDAYFIKDFRESDFLHPDGHPYTVLHQGKEYLQTAINRNRVATFEYFLRESEAMKLEFGRTGPNYDFGPAPLLWSPAVWRSLDEYHLSPKGEMLWDAIARIPSEIRWYGEALLAFKAIPLAPIDPLFRVYHHDWQYFTLRGQGENEQNLCSQYLGVIYQSNWDKRLDPASARKPLASRLWKNLKGLRHRF